VTRAIAAARVEALRVERARAQGVPVEVAANERSLVNKAERAMPALLRRWGRLVMCAATHWSSDNASTTGAALAFYCAFSLAPLLVILLTIAGAVVGAETAYGQVGQQLSALFGASTAKVILGAVESSRKTEGVVSTVVSIVTLLIGASTVLAALDAALEKIWRSEALLPGGVRGWVRTRLLSFGFILALGFLLLVSLTISTALSNLRGWIADRYTAIVGLIGILDFVATLVLVSMLFALIYRYMPARRTPWRVVIAGGVLTALLFNVGRWAISLYLAHSTQPSAYGAAASFAALLLWLYYTAQIFLFGAEFTACLAGLRDEAGPQATAVETKGHPS
jgi:membrane protein